MREGTRFALLVLVGGATGALLRHLHAQLVPGFAGTLAINLAGSLALAAFLATDPEPLRRAFFATGVCGAYTTFSTFEKEVVELGPWGLTYLGGSAFLGIVAVLVASRPHRTVLVLAPVGALVGAFLAKRELVPLDARLALVPLGGAAGALVRGAVSRKLALERFPLGTLVVNLVGCFLIGLAKDLSPGAQALLVTGGLGGLTTFSTFSWETRNLLETSRPRAAVNLAASLGGGVAAVALGRALA